jgi:trehalose-6-phosphate synthase
VDSTPDAVELDARRIGVGVDPIGIDVDGFRETLRDPETARLHAQIEEQYAGRSLVLGVERLDYTKGIPQKLLAYERFLERDPTRAQTTTMLQVLVPSRLESPEYQAQRNEIELLIARINGRFGQPGVTPVEYLHRDISKAGLVALYRRADVMMVTPLRDGMNLVAHEYVPVRRSPGFPAGSGVRCSSRSSQVPHRCCPVRYS